MIILLITDDPNLAVVVKILELQISGAEILRHVNRGTVGPEYQFLVQSLSSQVDPDGVIFFAIENPFL